MGELGCQGVRRHRGRPNPVRCHRFASPGLAANFPESTRCEPSLPGSLSTEPQEPSAASTTSKNSATRPSKSSKRPPSTIPRSSCSRNTAASPPNRAQVPATSPKGAPRPLRPSPNLLAPGCHLRPLPTFVVPNLPLLPPTSPPLLRIPQSSNRLFHRFPRVRLHRPPTSLGSPRMPSRPLHPGSTSSSRTGMIVS